MADRYYIYKKTIDFTENNSFFVCENIDFPIPKDNAGNLNKDKILLGFSGYRLSFADKNDQNGNDHHIKKMSLTLNADIENGKIKVTAGRELCDDSKHNMKSGSVDIALLILADDYILAENNAIELSAITGFTYDYGKDDHHITAYGANMTSAYMYDNNAHYASTSLSVNRLRINPELYNVLQEKKVTFVNAFHISFGENEDHHLLTTKIYNDGDAITCMMKDDTGHTAKSKDIGCNIYGYSDFLAKFWAVNSQAINKKYSFHVRYLGNVSDHIQGICKYKNYYFLTHSTSNNEDGAILVIDSNSDDTGYLCRIQAQSDEEKEKFGHPGGIQRMGKYMIVGSENKSHDTAHIRLYNLDNYVNSSNHELIERCKDFDIYIDDKGACAVGICMDTKLNRYIIASYDPNDPHATMTFYKSSAEQPLEKCKFEKAYRFSATDGDFSEHQKKSFKEFQNIALTYDESVDKIYLLGFRRHDLNDFIEVYEVEETDNSVFILKPVATRHMHTAAGGAGLEVHFRWGAGMDTADDGTITFLATNRNPHTHVDINTFS